MVDSEHSLEAFANTFKKWRGNRRYVRYPKSFWNEIQRLASHHPVEVIAKTLGVNAVYLQQRLSCGQSKTVSFATVQVVSSPIPASIELTRQNGQTITVRFQADHKLLLELIQALSGDGL